MGTFDQYHLGPLYGFVLRHELLPSIAARADRGVVQLEYCHREYRFLSETFGHPANSIQFGGVVLFAGIYYAVRGRHVYAGPVAYVRKDL